MITSRQIALRMIFVGAASVVAALGVTGVRSYLDRDNRSSLRNTEETRQASDETRRATVRVEDQIINSLGGGDLGRLNDAIRSGKSIEEIRAIVDRGVDLNNREQERNLPLVHAGEEGRPDVIKFLIERGADPNIRLEKGDSILMTLVSTAKKDVFLALIDGGADINAREDESGWTPMYWALLSGSSAIFQAAEERGLPIYGMDVTLRGTKRTLRETADGEIAQILDRVLGPKQGASAPQP